jgi:ethanolamine utilization protein EutA
LKKPKHTLQDHLYGADHGHSHGADADHDHDHDHDASAGPLEENPLWAHDNMALTSVGIDIGSAGTQVIFSRLHLRRLGEDLQSRYFVVHRETLYQSPVALTPYLDEVRIDERALGELIDQAYAAAGLHADNIDTGSVILTGEALRRENAQALGGMLAELGGEFVCATAGHHMEAMLAAYGSGAAEVSHQRDARILNVDIGGGTTKLALVERGKVGATAAIHIGGRLAVVDEHGRITRLDPAGARLARMAGLDWQLGHSTAFDQFNHLGEWMAGALCDALLDRRHDQLYLTERLPGLEAIQGVMFSGGVGEYVYGRVERDFGDLGGPFGRALRRRVEAGGLPWPLLPAGECIRATALGASEYSVQISGNTVYVSQPVELLPRKNLQVVHPEVSLQGELDPEGLAAAIGRHLEAFDVKQGEAEFALAFAWSGAPSYERISAFARALTLALAPTIAKRRPLYLVLDGDVAQTVGAILKEDWGIASEILAIDGIALRDFDYVDLGRIRMPSFTVPVTIKSLVFGQDPRG